MIYDAVTTDVFGISNVNIGFGLFQGRSNYIQSKYMDDNFWIEAGNDPTTGNEFFNVYLKED